MSFPQNEFAENEFAAHRAQLLVEIARQRGELAAAYTRLEKPIRYTEYGLRGFGFLRSNPWILALAPTVLSLALTFFGRKKAKPTPPPLSQRQSLENPPKGIKGAVVKGAGYLWKAFQLYRRVRPYFL